jgi:hypothetical protein
MTEKIDEWYDRVLPVMQRNVRIIVAITRMILFSCYMSMGLYYAYQIAYCYQSFITYIASVCLMLATYRFGKIGARGLAYGLGREIIRGFRD